jgi:hypothetical protein
MGTHQLPCPAAFQESDMLFPHGYVKNLIPKLRGFILVRQERKIKLKAKYVFYFLKREAQYGASVHLKMFP